MQTPYQNFSYFGGYSEPMMYNNQPKSSHKTRRKSSVDPVKHRRTRSGCFMCRSRRVKCDETRPVCDRCRKGHRECIYPDPPPSKGPGAHGQSSKDGGSLLQQASPASSGDTEDHDDNIDSRIKRDVLHDLPEDDEEYDLEPPPKLGSISSKDSPTESTETSSSHTATARVTPERPSLFPGASVDWSRFSPDVQRYMQHYHENITNHHYCIPHDGDDFFHTILPGFAARNEALLNAVVGFSAYHYNIENNPNGKVQEFLQYYNRSVTLLISFLRRREKPDVATLLTILQLATIEEYLGDWINLMGHQKAAYELLTELFTPQSAVQSPLGRLVVHWYSRFDVFVAIRGSFPTMLPTQWFTEYRDYCQAQAALADKTTEYHWHTEAELANFRHMSRDISTLVARGSRGQLTPEEFATDHSQLVKRMENWRSSWHPVVADPDYLVTDFTYGPPANQDDIVDPYTPGVLYSQPKFATTMMSMLYLSCILMLKCQSPTKERQQLYRELAGHSYEVCQVFELIARWPGSPKGSIIATDPVISMAALFLPLDTKHTTWFRRKLAMCEMAGNIHPITIRTKLGELFNATYCAHWWLPNDEGFTPILQATRNLADERNAAAIDAQQENLREVHHVFAKLKVDQD